MPILLKYLMQHLEREAKENYNGQPSVVVWDELLQIHDQELIMALPESNMMIGNVIRTQNVNKCALPRILQECVFKPPDDTILDGEHFLQLDSDVNYLNHMVIFYTQEGLWHLVTSRIIYCDGIFKAVPCIF